MIDRLACPSSCISLGIPLLFMLLLIAMLLCPTYEILKIRMPFEGISQYEIKSYPQSEASDL
jgi:hypothetical protein